MNNEIPIHNEWAHMDMGMDSVLLESDSFFLSVDKEEVSLLTGFTEKPENTAFKGTPIPYKLSTDDGITTILILCFFLTAYVLASSKKIIFQQLKNYFQIKERGSLFADSALIDIRYRLLLIFQTCVLLGICFFDYFYDKDPQAAFYYSPSIIVGIYVIICMFYYVIKWLIYSFLSWIFLDKIRGIILMDSYFFMISCLGIVLFPLTLLGVYFDLRAHIFVPLLLGVVVLTKFLMFYKGIKLFFDKLYGLLGIIVYFCALELMPCFILFQVLARINNLLLIKL